MSRNVAFDIDGHAFFIEDGTETGNYIEDNLALRVNPSFSMLATDVVPGGFWITNFGNYVRRNVAADVKGVGHWFSQGLGAFVTGDWPDPSAVPMAAWEDNRAHSVDSYGVRGGVRSPHVAGVPAEIKRFNAYGCGTSGMVLTNAGDVRLVDFAVAAGATAAVEVIEADDGGAGGLKGGAFLGGDAPGAHGVITPGYLDGWTVDGASFMDFDAAGSAVRTCAHCEWVNTMTAASSTVYVSNLRFTNVSTRVSWGPQRHGILRDAQNTLGAGAGDVVPDWPHLVRCPRGALPDATRVCGSAGGVSVWSFSDCGLEYVPATVTALGGAPVAGASSAEPYYDEFFRAPQRGWAALVASGGSYAFALQQGHNWIPGYKLNGGVTVEANSLDAGAWVILRLEASGDAAYQNWHVWMPDPQENLLGRQDNSHCKRVAATRLDRMPTESDAHGSFYVARTGWRADSVYVMYRGSGVSRSRSLRVVPDVCPLSGCAGPQPAPMGSVLAPISAGQLPRTTDASGNMDVTVPPDRQLSLSGDLDLRGSRLWVMGSLRVTGAATLAANDVIVYGELVAEGKPFNLRLVGQRPIALSDAIFEEGGTLLCLGRCALSGARRVPWARLSGGASDAIETSSATDWAPGEVLAVSDEHGVSYHAVTGASAGTLRVTPPLRAGAPGGTFRNLPYGLSLDTRPSAALLNRSVSVFGSPRCRILVTDHTHANRTYSGNATVADVALHGCGTPEVGAFDVGTMATSQPGACEACPAERVPLTGAASLSRAAVFGSRRSLVRAVSARAISVENSSAISSVGTAVELATLGSQPAVVGNLIAGVGAAPGPPCCQPTACLSVCSVFSVTESVTEPCVGRVTDNVCAKSAQAGYVLYGVPCGERVPYARNQVHHATVGAIIHASPSARCTAAAGFSAHACSEVGIPAPYGQVAFSGEETRYSGLWSRPRTRWA